MNYLVCFDTSGQPIWHFNQSHMGKKRREHLRVVTSPLAAHAIISPNKWIGKEPFSHTNIMYVEASADVKISYLEKNVDGGRNVDHEMDLSESAWIDANFIIV